MAVTVQQEVAALYSAIFNRAPDQEGLNNWVNLIQGGASLSQAADGFVQHPVFTELYAGLTNIQFVQQLYINVLGSEGDAKGIQNWANLLASGVSKAQVVADFVQGALSVDLDAMLASGELTQAEYDAAVIRQDTLTNKANVGVYFAETFGAASNLDPATDTSTVAGLQADPAYLASQAAIANVTADAATVTAAQGRIDVAVATDDPAGNLVGANSELTAALVDLQEKVAAQADALEAVGIAQYLNGDATPTAAEQTTFLLGYDATDARDAVTDAQTELAAQQSELADANNDLLIARASKSDAALKAEVNTRLAAVNNDAVAKGLYEAANTAAANLQADITAKGDSVALLTAVRAALSTYANAGGDLAADADGSGTTYASYTALLSAINTALGTDAAASVTNPGTTAASDALVGTLKAAGLTDLSVNPAVPAATDAGATAYNAAVANIVARVGLIEADSDAEDAFADPSTGNTLGVALRSAETAVDTRDGLIDKVAAEQSDVTDAQTYLAEVTELYNAYLAAAEATAGAEATIEGLGYELNTTGAGTSADDLFVADLSSSSNSVDAAITSFGTAGDDLLFIGTQYQFGGATSATVTQADLFAAGKSNALEVFIEQTGGNTFVHVETETFSSNAANDVLSNIVTIELAGVTGDVVFENGFISIA
ncbi:DUF4214 domain-containing protein [Stutzerimonas kunmingensis]|uniref:DUF4214 domain-containing protein n=1 Tax=Stutzerimonas kunmingensis TaxID=1211807 RepID=UPI0026EE39D7|nr:DUF4214 domain-containing protein [Stutzerimonas kunmingensis]